MSGLQSHDCCYVITPPWLTDRMICVPNAVFSACSSPAFIQSIRRSVHKGWASVARQHAAFLVPFHHQWAALRWMHLERQLNPDQSSLKGREGRKRGDDKGWKHPGAAWPDGTFALRTDAQWRWWFSLNGKRATTRLGYQNLGKLNGK